MHGTEANIIGYDGSLDMEECYDEVLRTFRIPVEVEETREFL